MRTAGRNDRDDGSASAYLQRNGARRPASTRRVYIAMGVGSQVSGPNQGPHDQGLAMSDKSPRQTMSKKPGKSLKEKRAAKHAKVAARASKTEALFHDKKH